MDYKSFKELLDRIVSEKHTDEKPTETLYSPPLIESSTRALIDKLASKSLSPAELEEQKERKLEESFPAYKRVKQNGTPEQIEAIRKLIL